MNQEIELKHLEALDLPQRCQDGRRGECKHTSRSGRNSDDGQKWKYEKRP
jgi:hypothetical protein